MPKLVFFGNERLASAVTTTAPILRSLIDTEYEITAVVINQKQGRGRTLEVAEVASSYNIPVISLDELIENFDSYKTDTAVLAAFGKIIPQSVIDLFPVGIVNIHPSLLPRYRGSTPIESAILNGDTETGVSLMKIVAEMDAGPIFATERISLIGDETKQELYEMLSKLSAQLLIQNLPSIIDGHLVPTDQNTDVEQPSYSKTITKNDGQIDWSKSATILEREVRAYAGWPSSYTTLVSRDVTITEVSIVEESGNSGEIMPGKKLIVYCGDRALEITKLKPAGKREMQASDFLLGVR